MGDVNSMQLTIAAAKADKSEAAGRLINEAGKGMMDVFNSARANTVTLSTLAKMQVAQGFLTEAAVLLLEVVALDHDPKPPLEVPEGARG